MALKQKGIPKAGPKKRRAKTEAERIRAAVKEQGVRNKGKRSRVRSYTYKDAKVAKRKKVTAFEREQRMQYSLRSPDGPTQRAQFRASLPDDAKPFADMYFEMECGHAENEDLVLTASFVEGSEPSHVRCKHCGMVRRWWGTKTETKRQEWIGYCPDGYDMFEWSGLYVKDRSLWRFIHDEVLAEMLEATMVSEEAG